MDIKKMAELVRAKVREVDDAGIFEELAAAVERKEKPDSHNIGNSEEKENEERDRS